MAETTDLDTIRTILAAGRTAIVTTRGKGGVLHSRPLALLDQGPDGGDDWSGTLWFFTQDPSEKTDELRRHDQVNVSVSDGKGFLSLAGRASIDRSQARIDQLWNAFADAYFDGGREDPTVALIRIDVDTVEFWDTNQPAPKRAFELAKAMITRREPDLGDNGRVEL